MINNLMQNHFFNLLIRYFERSLLIKVKILGKQHPEKNKLLNQKK